MRLKYSSGLVLMIVLVMVLSACGGQATAPAGGEATAAPAAGGAATAPAAEQPTAAPDAAPAEPTPEIQFEQEPAAGQKVVTWMTRTGPDENRWQRDVVLPAWQKAHPDVFIKVINLRQADIAVKRQAMIAAKEPLDVWSPNWGGNGFASDRLDGLLADMSPLIARDKFDTSDFIPEIFSIYAGEGKQYGIPFLSTGSYVFYNMKLFDAAGVPHPPTSWEDKSWNWEKFVATAKQLAKNQDDPNTAVYGADFNDVYPMFDALQLVFGKDPWTKEALASGFSDPIKITDDVSINAFQKFHDLVYVDKVAPDPASVQALSQLGGSFQSGRVAMTLNGGWGMWTYKPFINDTENGFCWGAAPIPWGTPDANVRATIFTDPWSITAGLSQEQTDLAWQFVQFLAASESAKAYTEATGAPPVRKSLLEDYYKQYEKCMPPDKVKEVFTGAFTHGRESSNHLLVNYDELYTTWSNTLSTFWTDPNGKAADVLPQLESDTNALLQRIKDEKKK